MQPTASPWLSLGIGQPADWSHPIGEAFPNVHAYRRRLLARPFFARAVEEVRHIARFPLDTPDRD